MTPLTRFAAVAAVIGTLVAVLGLVPLTASPSGQAQMSRTPAAAASPSPLGPLDTSAWVTYTSDRYGFSIGHPSNWSERSAIRTWTLADEADWRSPAQESFIAPDASIRVAVWSVAIQPGTVADAWIASYCRDTKDTPCTDMPTTPEALDGHPGTLVRFNYDTQAFFLIGDRMYVLAAWQPESHPSAAPYGGATRLLEAYLSTMHLLPDGPALDTSSWKTYTSDRYGFSIGHPADWSEQPSTRQWTMADTQNLPYFSVAEHFLSPTSSVGVSAWAVPLDPGTTANAWIQSYCQLLENDPGCGAPGPLTIPVTVDGHPGSLMKSSADTLAFIPVGDTVYVVVVWQADADPATTSYGGSARLLEGFLSTMHLFLAGSPSATAAPSSSSVAGVRNGWVAYTSGSEAGVHLVREGTAPRVIPPNGTGSVVDACPAFSPDGRRLAYGEASDAGEAGYRDASLVVADINPDGTVTGSTRVPLEGVTIPPCAAWSSDGRHIAFGVETDPHGAGTTTADEPWPGQGAAVWIVDLDAGNVRRLADLPVTDLEWSPDGTELAISAGGIVSYSIATDDVAPLGTATDVTSLTWAPDGQHLAYERRPTVGSDDKELWIERADGSHPQLVADGYNAFHGVGPVWSPDGSQIVYQVHCPPEFWAGKICREPHNAVLVSLETDGPDLITSSPVVLPQPQTKGSDGWSPFSVTWSPDGTRLLYLGWAAHNGIVAAPVDGAAAVLLAEDDNMAAYGGAPWLTFQAWGRLAFG